MIFCRAQNIFYFVFQVTVGQDFIATGALVEQIRLCVLLVSSVPVEHQPLCLVPKEHIALKQETLIKTTAPSVPLDTTAKVGNMENSKIHSCLQ